VIKHIRLFAFSVLNLISLELNILVILVSIIYPFDSKKDIRFGNSSTTIKLDPFFEQQLSLFNEIKAKPQLFI
jgi:hypothetical protein